MKTRHADAVNEDAADRMIRGALPSIWALVLGMEILLHAMPIPNGPFRVVWMQVSHVALWPAILVLTIVTFFLGLPSRQDLIAGTVAGLLTGAAMLGAGVCLLPTHSGWFVVTVLLLALLSVKIMRIALCICVRRLH